MRCRRFASLQGRIRFLSATRFSPRPIPAKTRINSCFGGSGWRERRQARWRFRRREFGGFATEKFPDTAMKFPDLLNIFPVNLRRGYRDSSKTDQVLPARERF